MKERFQQLKNWYLSHERHVGTGALVLGFIVDNLTLQRIDLLFENAVLITYLVLIAGGLFVLNLARGDYFSQKMRDWMSVILPPLVQFGFGGIFSAFFVFYTRSAALASSWMFMLFLVFLLVGNEFFREQYLRLRFQVPVFFIALFSFLVFFVPVLLKDMGPWIFILSGALALGGIALFLFTLSRFVPESVREHKRGIVWSIILIYALMNVLYFANIIPPIPLALKDIRMAHSVARNVGPTAQSARASTYMLVVEDVSFIRRWLPGEVYHRQGDEGVSVFSSVFAPTDLDTTIRHCWEYLDETNDVWMPTQCITFPISGGRDGGYRGYSTKRAVFPGKWRVDVETQRGQLIGRKVFVIVNTTEPAQLETTVR